MQEEHETSRQHRQLRQIWPATTATLEATYFQRPTWAITDELGHNAAGYVLWGLTNFNSRTTRIYPHHHYKIAELDQAAAREVAYQWMHGRHFTRPEAALTTCWLNLVTERPEKLAQARVILRARRGASDETTRQNSYEQSTATPSSPGGYTHTRSQPHQIGCVLQELMPLSCTQSHSQAQPPHATS